MCQYEIKLGLCLRLPFLKLIVPVLKIQVLSWNCVLLESPQWRDTKLKEKFYSHDPNYYKFQQKGRFEDSKILVSLIVN